MTTTKKRTKKTKTSGTALPRAARLETARVPIEWLQPDPENARVHGERDLAVTERSLRRHNQVQFLLVQKGTGRIIDGHGRYELLRRLGESEADVVLLDVDDARAREIALLINRSAELARWDLPRLEAQLQELETIGLDADLDLGFGRLDLDQLLHDLETGVAELDAADARETDTPEPPTDPVTRPGDVWTFPTGHRLVCGDATDPAVTALSIADDRPALLWTDPPYGVAYDAQSARDGGRDWRTIQNDALQGEALERFFGTFLDAARDRFLPNAAMYVCMANATQHHMDKALRDRGIYQAVPIVWVKQSAPISWHRYHPQHEVILYAGAGAKPTGRRSRWYGPKNETTVWRVDRDPTKAYRHPTQKPVALPARALRNSTRRGECVYDPFLGSGTALVAAEQMGRRLLGVELEPAWCDVALDRYAHLTGRRPTNQDGREYAPRA